MTLSVQTNDPIKVGLHNIDLVVTLANHAGPTITVSFTVDIQACVVTSVVLATGDPNEGTPTLAATINSAADIYALPVFVQTPACGLPVTVTLGTTQPFMTFADPNYDIQSTDFALDGVTNELNFFGTAGGVTSAEVKVMFSWSALCTDTTISAVAIPNMATTVMAGAVTQTFAFFPDALGIQRTTDNTCGDRVYTLSGTDTSFVTLTTPTD